MTERSASSAESGYLLDNRAADAAQRFDSLSALFNPVTFRHLEAIGIAAGWHCWEVGVGGPSIPEWLSSRVGPSGQVLATDIDVRWAGQLAGGNVEVRQRNRGRSWPLTWCGERPTFESSRSNQRGGRHGDPSAR